MFYKDKNHREIEKTMELTMAPEIMEMTAVMQRQHDAYQQQTAMAQQRSAMAAQGMVMPKQAGMVPQQQMAQPIDLPRFIIKEFSLLKKINMAWLLIALPALGFFGYSIYENYQNESLFTAFLLPVLFTGVAAYKVIDALLNMRGASNDMKNLESDLKKGFQTVPRFLLKIIESINVRKVDMNWFAMLTYAIVGGFVLFTTKAHGWTIPLINYTFNFEGLKLQQFFGTIILITVFVFHVWFHIWTRIRLDKINSFYGKDVVPREQITELKRARNKFYRRLLLIITLIAAFAIVIASKALKKAAR